MAQTLYELLTGLEGDSLNWNERPHQAFEELKLAITSTSALGLPDLAKLFTLYVTEEDKVAMGLLSQTMWMWDRPVASQNSWTVLPLGGQDAYGQLLWLPYWSWRRPG